MSKKEHGNKLITINNIDDLVFKNYKHINKIQCFGETTYFYNKKNKKKRGTYFLTIKQYDGPNDKKSELDRKNIYRISFKLTDDNYKDLFGKIHKKTDKLTNFDFTKINHIIPHPVYFYMKWIQILNPKYNNYYKIKDCLDNIYEKIK
jgi:hypothetical protein